MDHARIVYEAGRFVVVAVWCAIVYAVERRLTRYEALCDARLRKGVIARGLCALCSLAGFLWSKLPCGGWQPQIIVNVAGRPCDCESED